MALVAGEFHIGDIMIWDEEDGDDNKEEEDGDDDDDADDGDVWLKLSAVVGSEAWPKVFPLCWDQRAGQSCHRHHPYHHHRHRHYGHHFHCHHDYDQLEAKRSAAEGKISAEKSAKEAAEGLHTQLVDEKVYGDHDDYEDDDR